MDFTIVFTFMLFTWAILCNVSSAMGLCKFDAEFRQHAPTAQNGNKTFRDCYDVYMAGHKENGIYSILPSNWLGPPFNVLCNMTTIGGGWTILQRRKDGSENFFRNWNSYKYGFGSLYGEFWIGNEKLYYLTNQREYKLRIDIVTNEDSPLYSEYSSFGVDDEDNKYRVTHIGSFSGDGGDGMAKTHMQPFSTYDQDTVCSAEGYNCASNHQSGWWFTNTWCRNRYPKGCSVFPLQDNKGCTYGNLNGNYTGGDGSNIFWDVVGSEKYCRLKFVEMKVRPFQEV